MNLREAHDLIYSEIEPGQTVRLFIANTIIIGSTTYHASVLDIGDWPDGITPQHLHMILAKLKMVLILYTLVSLLRLVVSDVNKRSKADIGIVF